ncbi:MAG: 3-oxoacyl-ACP reductase [Lentisphaerae bacterium GWF2_45_14]|nr:MAG: 3-oxoacyl-ACP reductase [Lentisphaerae bacterium GWF2_45_14]
MKNKLALVIGGSRGIGRATVLRLATLGFEIIFSCRAESEEALSTRDEATALNAKCSILTFNLENRTETMQKVETLCKERVPDVIVYNAGISRDNILAFMSPDEWDQVMRVNLDGFYNVIQPAVFHMLARKSGRIIVVTSASGQTGQAGQVNYSASKAGLIGAVKALAREIGRKNIFVNAVAPGVIETAMTEKLPKEKIKPLIPLNRFGKPEDVASVIGFLAAEENMYIHGQVIGINGGLVL